MCEVRHKPCFAPAPPRTPRRRPDWVFSLVHRTAGSAATPRRSPCAWTASTESTRFSSSPMSTRRAPLPRPMKRLHAHHLAHSRTRVPRPPPAPQIATKIEVYTGRPAPGSSEVVLSRLGHLSFDRRATILSSFSGIFAAACICALPVIAPRSEPWRSTFSSPVKCCRTCLRPAAALTRPLNRPLRQTSPQSCGPQQRGDEVPGARAQVRPRLRHRLGAQARAPQVPPEPPQHLQPGVSSSHLPLLSLLCHAALRPRLSPVGCSRAQGLA